MPGTLFYTIVIGVTSGILFRSFFDSSFPGVLCIMFLALTLALQGRLKKRGYLSGLFLSSYFFVAVLVGVLSMELREQQDSPLHTRVGESRVWEGVVVREPDRRQTSTHLYMKESDTEHIVLVISDPYELVAYGDRISVEGKLSLPEAFETDTGRMFDYVGYLKARGVTETILYGDITVLEHNMGNAVLRRLYAVKHALMEALELAIPEPAVGLGEGVLLGVKRALGEDLTEIFRMAGIMHIVVLSGYNIMIVADFIMRVLGYFFLPRTRLAFGIVSIVLFALLVGLSATVVRASIMAALVLIARETGRQYAVLRALCLTGLLMLLINPYLLAFDPGFQLSFLATLGLILIAPRIEERLSVVPEKFGIRGYLATTLGTQLYVLPLLLFSMGTVSVVSVVVNMLVLPIVPIAMFATFVVGLVGLVSETVALGLGFGAYVVLMYIVNVATIAASLPFAETTLPQFHVLFMALMFAGIGVLTYWMSRGATSGEIRPQENEYADWVIEEEASMPVGMRRVPTGMDQNFPFK